MGSCCSKPEPPRGVEGTREGRLRTLLRRLCPRGNPPLAETVELEGVPATNEKRTSLVNLRGEEDGVAISQLRKSIEDKESQTELAGSLTRAERDLNLLTQQHDEAEASFHAQISQLQTQITELSESRSLAENELEALKVQHNEAEASLHSQILQLQSQISELTKSLSQTEIELHELIRQRDEAEASALAQLEQQKGTLELRDLVTELSEVADWFHLGLQLGVPFPKLVCCVQRSTSPHESCGKTYMLREWMDRMGSKASWAHVVAALVRIKMGGLAQRLSDKYGVPLPLADESPLDIQQGSSHSEESQSTNARLLAVTHTICEKLERYDENLFTIKFSMETAKNDRHTIYENTLTIKGAVEDVQSRVENLKKERDFIAVQLNARERDLSFLQELLHLHTREIVELKLIIQARKEEVDDLRRSLRETEGKLESANEDARSLKQQLREARRMLEASCSRVRQLERERAELQAEVNRERREVDRRLMEAAGTTPTQEPAQEIEYQAMELLCESSELKVSCRQEDSQSEEQIGELLVRVRELENLNLTWRKYTEAPEQLFRGSAAIDIYRHIAYFSDWCSVCAYEWQREEWSKLPDCPQRGHTLAVVNGLLTAVGGGQIRSRTNTLLSLIGEGSKRKWEKHFPPMPTKRRSTAVVYSGKHLVVIGGRGDNGIVTTVEVMNTETREWFTASSLPFPLTEATVTIVGDKIYLVGGYDENGRMTRLVLTCSLTALLQSCQPQTPSLWHRVADTPVYRSICVTLDGELVAVGGCDLRVNPTDAVYAYDPATDSWNVISHMNVARHVCLAAVLPGDRLMVVGGRITNSLVSCAVVEIAT